jgi:[pyruvate, water dikinase]-phosphate phosphotransferase / [pyruvate, water dikinase] kinase
MTDPIKRFHLHLVSDATGETLNGIARACLVQFEQVEPVEHMWSMVRSARQLEKVLAGISANKGVVLYTLIEEHGRAALEAGCRALGVPCIPVLDPTMGALTNYLGLKTRNLPGRQHALDAEYFRRIDAINWVMAHDDGMSSHGLADAEVILIGVSRTSKTPTCIYLANRGIKAANVPFVPGVALPGEIAMLEERAEPPIFVGLTNDPNMLVQLRRNRLNMLNENRETDYTDLEKVKSEVVEARRFFGARGWPVIDVARRSIEETAAQIMSMVQERREKAGKPA